ncbi:MAG: hypothetical protein FD149_1937 [Rhodospirillaceae bacterium]|nr:MAG: hypothetical protein FD149_1937 [Rhodospirillaceae bacterium]
MALIADVKWQERYASYALNRTLAGNPASIGGLNGLPAAVLPCA